VLRALAAMLGEPNFFFFFVFFWARVPVGPMIARRASRPLVMGSRAKSSCPRMEVVIWLLSVGG